VLADERYGSLVLAIILTDRATSGLKFLPILEALRAIQPTKPVIFAGLDEGAEIEQRYVDELRAMGIPFFPTTDRAFRALAHVTRLGSRVEPAEGPERLLNAAVSLPSGVIPEYESKRILAEAGIRVPQGEMAKTVEEACAAAGRIGYPVVLKAQSALLSHKSDVGGVALKLRNADEVRKSWAKMHSDISAALPGLPLDGILVEAMGEWGTELIVGVHCDPDWGPVLMVGLGGVMAEALGDMRLMVPGLPRAAVVEELLQLKCAALLRGFRGSPELDVNAAAETVVRLGELVLANPSIREIDINPLIVYPKGKGTVALDALIVVS